MAVAKQINEHSLAELDVVETLRALPTATGREMPAGSRGSIVEVWREGVSYVVEFVEPFPAIVTVPDDALTLVERVK